MDQKQVEQLIIDLVADGQNRDPDNLREELEALGAELPIDSLLAVEVLASVEAQCGVTLSTDAEHAEAMKSVAAFAAAVVEELEEVRRSASGGEVSA